MGDWARGVVLGTSFGNWSKRCVTDFPSWRAKRRLHQSYVRPSTWFRVTARGAIDMVRVYKRRAGGITERSAGRGKMSRKMVQKWIFIHFAPKGSKSRPK